MELAVAVQWENRSIDYFRETHAHSDNAHSILREKRR